MGQKMGESHDCSPFTISNVLYNGRSTTATRFCGSSEDQMTCPRLCLIYHVGAPYLNKTGRLVRKDGLDVEWQVSGIASPPASWCSG